MNIRKTPMGHVKNNEADCRRVEFAENHAGHSDPFVQIYADPLKTVPARKNDKQSIILNFMQKMNVKLLNVCGNELLVKFYCNLIGYTSLWDNRSRDMELLVFWVF